jgi:hypothetical protein
MSTAGQQNASEIAQRFRLLSVVSSSLGLIHRQPVISFRLNKIATMERIPTFADEHR